MDWIQTFTIISTIIAALYAFYVIMKEDLKRHDIEFSETKEQFSKMNDRFSRMDERFLEEVSKRDALWANLLQKIHNVDKKFYILEKQIYEIKLDQSKKA